MSIRIELSAEKVAALNPKEFAEWNREWTDRFCDEEAIRWHERCGTDEEALKLFTEWQWFARHAMHNPLQSELMKTERECFGKMVARLIALRDSRP